MTKEQALKKTQDRFTNLMDGKVLSNATVYVIINYYETLLAGSKPKVSTVSNIERNFIEADIQALQNDLEDEAGYPY
jgi:hypothetical protein